jgi:hypothetical protein
MTRHIPDEELVRLLDGEVDPPEAARLRAHLDVCAGCRQRCAGFRDTTQTVADLRRSFVVPRGDSARARLKTRLRERESRLWLPTTRVAASAAAALAAIAVPALWMLTASQSAAGPLPNARITPGVARAAAQQAVCRMPAGDEGRTVPAGLAQRVFALYGIEKPPPRAYELDYLISPALGGTGDIGNLWPVPYSGGVWTSRVKDALEDHLRELVCSGKLDLATAQREIARDWIAAYRKHFRTETPLAEHAAFVKDSPWE